MSAEAPVAQDVRHVATRIAQRLHASPDDAAACLDEFAAACHALPPGQTAIDLASALAHHSVALFLRLETAALHRFQKQLQRLRPLSGGSTKMPRALAELRSAARAWGVSPLVLLAEFSQAPTSDNFWRLLSKLARSSRHRSWPADRNRLHAARRRRFQDLLVRRKGVRHVQPWAIPDIVSLLQEQEPEPVGQNQETEEAGAVANEDTHPAQARVRDDGGAATLSSPLGARQHMSSSPLPSAPLEGSGEDDGNKEDNVGDHEDHDDGKDWTNTIQASDSEHTSIWRISYGWWLPSDTVGRLCASLAQIQPNFVVTAGGVSCATTVYQPGATLVVPFRRKMHWTLATVCLPEKVVSVYDPLSSNKDRPSQADTDIKAALEGLVSTQQLAGAMSLAVVDCAIVARSCPQTKSIDSGVAAIALSLYCLVGRALPQKMDSWLWRRMLANYLAQFPSDNAEQTAKNLALAAVFSANHTGLYEHTNLTRPFGRRNRMALRDDAMEGRAVWMAAARLANNAKADALIRSRRYGIQCALRRSRHAAESERRRHLETAGEAAEACTAITAVANGIRAVLDDLDRLLGFLVAQQT